MGSNFTGYRTVDIWNCETHGVDFEIQQYWTNRDLTATKCTSEEKGICILHYTGSYVVEIKEEEDVAEILSNISM